MLNMFLVCLDDTIEVLFLYRSFKDEAQSWISCMSVVYDNVGP